ncbi:AraC family transcriptional regulator [Yoonia sp. 2307UL14-13]|uniref:AraC family transcriptional regulator n=1 Tax=Yoonia sp. 2307UL14-13 TaxID=3126506 RepID=UPI0030963D8E
MNTVHVELEVIPDQSQSLIFLEHGWPDPLCRWHAHKECELHLIVASTGRSYIGDYIGDFAAGDLFLIGPHLPHNWVTDEVWIDPIATRDLVIQFDQDRVLGLMSSFPEFDGLQQLLNEAASGLQFSGFDIQDAQRRFLQIRDVSGPQKIIAFFDFLLALAAHKDRHMLSAQQLYHEKRSKTQERICDVVDHVSRNFSDPISLDEAADIAGMSPTAFARNFQKTTGSRFNEFVTKVRIGQACSMLQATDTNIATICHDVGFRNLANFNRHFLKVKAMTPSAYRGKARADLGGEM